MKKKLVVKTLALLLTSVMVMETPMQSFAAEAQDTVVASEETSAEDAPAESEEAPAEESTPEGTEAPAGEEKTKQEETPMVNKEKPAEEEKTEEAAPEDKKAEEPPVTEEKTEEAATTTQEQPAQDNPLVVQEADLEGEAAVQAKTTEVEWFIEASRFGMVPKSDFDKVANESLENTVKSAMESFEEKEINEKQISAAYIEQIIVKILENNPDNYTKVSPNVILKKDSSDYVTSVKFSEISEGSASIKNASAADNGNVTLTYSVQTGLTKVEFRRVPMDGEGNYSWENPTTVDAGEAGSTFIDTTAAPGDYAYILYGYTGDKVSICSNVITCTYTLPEVKNFKVASTDRTGTTLSWDKLDPAQGYELSRSGSDGSNTVLGEFGKDTTTYTDTATAADVTYTYTLKAFIKDGEEKRWTSETRVEGVQAKSSSVSRPSLSFVSPASDQATLNWNGNAEGYEVYKVNNGSYEKVTEITSTSYQLNGLEVGQTYSYAVCPFKKNGSYRVYGAMSDTVNVTTFLSGSSIQASAAAYNQINLAWAQTAQADGYEIYRNGQLLQTIWGGSNCSYADTAIACGTTYSYQVRAFKNTNGTTSYGAFSGEASAVTSLPGTSMQGASSQEYQTVTITWNQGVGATGYELYRSNTSGTNYSLLADITDGNITSYRDTAVTVGETWFYKVRPYRVENGQKVYGPETGEVSGLVTLGSVSGVNAWASAYNRIELTWNKLSYATG